MRCVGWPGLESLREHSELIDVTLLKYLAMMTLRYRTILRYSAMLVAVLSLTVLSSQEAAARVRLKDICRVSGEREVKLVGIGLVTGLAGTGSGGKNLPALRALAAKLKLMHAPALEFSELKGAKNFDLVMIEATIPKNGARRGQKIDCYVTSFVSAKSLVGGRLMPAPLETAEVDDDVTRGIASGGLVIEGTDSDVVGKISPQEQQAWASYYFKHRFQLLTSEQRERLSQNPEQQVQHVIQSLISSTPPSLR